MTGLMRAVMMIKHAPSMPQWTCLCVFVFALPCRIYAVGVQDICSSEEFRADCGRDEVVVINTAEYGRMEEVERCYVTSEGGSVGCSNDVMGLVDVDCSGKRECRLIVGNHRFNEFNTNCNRHLHAYLRISYTCEKVVFREFSQCLTQTRVPINQHEGFISSHVTDETGCGSTKAPWTISARPGQTIDLTIWDFGVHASRQSASRTGCSTGVYGYIAENSLDVNQTYCSGSKRKDALYSSTSNAIELSVVQQSQRHAGSLFLIHFKVMGCSDLTPPAHAWYKRKDRLATIGCRDSETRWELNCHGNLWDGVVGNCSAKPLMAADTAGEPVMDISVKTLLIVAAIAGGTIVLAVLIIVAGVVCIKKYRHESEWRASSLPSTLVYQAPPSTPGEAPARGQYHPMTMTKPSPGSSTMGSVHHACTMVQRSPMVGVHRGSFSAGQQSPMIGTQRAGIPGVVRVASFPATARRPNKQEAPPPPNNHFPAFPQQRAPQSAQPRPLPQPGTSSTSASPNRPLIAVPEDEMTAEFDGPGVYQNPDDIIIPAGRPDPPTSTPPIDPDEISSYYAPTTGHKYFILERQPEVQTESPS